MINDYTRQLEIFNNEKFDKPVHVIGAGASGSWVVMMLAKLGVKDVHIWDFDIVEEHNVPNQAFAVTQIGMKKIDATQMTAEIFGKKLYTTHNEKVTGTTPLAGIVFVLTDTMSSRLEIWKGALKFKPQVDLVIETRMGLDMCRIYNVNPMNMDEVKGYESTFSYGDEQAEVSACGASKSVVTSAMTVASIAVRQLLNFNNGLELPNEIIYDFTGNHYFTTRWGA